MTTDLLVVGAGVAGLVVAHDAARAGARVIVLEASDDVGGLVRRGTLAGVDIDLGAESFATRTSAVAELAAELGLPTCAPRPAGARLVVERDGVIARLPLPRRTVLGIPADPVAADVVAILGEHGARDAAAEIARPLDGPEPTLADLVASRCGSAVAERLVDPLCQSVYSRPADTVRLSELHPVLWRVFLETGSLIAATARVSTEARAGAAVGGVTGGMWRLATTLRERAEAAGAEIRTGVAVHDIERAAGGLTVRTADGSQHADRVVITTGPAATRALIGAPPVSSRGVRLVSALVASDALDANPVGSGVIVAAGVPSRAKALTHTSAKWAWADLGPGRHLVRLSARESAAPGLDTAEDVAREVSVLTGIPIAAENIEALTTATWSDAVAQAPLDPAQIAAAERCGIHFAGAVVAGTGLASVVPHARALALTLVERHAPVRRIA